MSDIFITLIKSVLLLHCGNKILSVEWYIIFCTGMTYSVRGTHCKECSVLQSTQ